MRQRVTSNASHKRLRRNDSSLHARVPEQQFVASDQQQVGPGCEQLPQQLVTRIMLWRSGDRREHDGMLGDIGELRLDLCNSQSMQLAQTRPHEHGAVFSKQGLGHDKGKGRHEHVIQHAR